MEHPEEKLLFLFMLIMFPSVALATAAAASQDCERQCGNLEIPYPFGMKKGCYLNENFLVTCNKTHYHPPKAFLRGSNIEVTHISILPSELHILNYVARDCYTKDGRPDISRARPFLVVDMFSISNTKNKLTIVGCDTYGYLHGEIQGEIYSSGCMALCGNSSRTIKDGSCSGSGCCQLEIPKGLKEIQLDVRSFNNHTRVHSLNPCGYAFVIQQNRFTFSKNYIKNFTESKVPLVLDWGIKNDTCQPPNHKDKCLCGPNSQKNSSLSLDGSEYYCQCLDGFHGNPYLSQGCQDIDECQDGSHECKFKHQCVNTPGNYTCNCPKNYKGDGRRGGEGCTQNTTFFILIIIGIVVGLLVLGISSMWLYLAYKKWRFIQQKAKFFNKNGGLVLQEHISQWQSSSDMLRIFTREELEKATNNFDESVVVGKGGYGTVYKGVLMDGSIIAIKKSKLVDQSQTKQFINEVIILSQINHRNVVKLLGCCLETRVPLLVYEFITNGTLFEHIHRKNNHSFLSWKTRLKIASQTAGVLSYLHSSASTPIIHRDIKSTNILLDHNYTAKVSDFGASKLVPLDQTQISTMVQGTLGYLDPEYLLTSELTEKSDVYSFGIVLLELITGKKAVTFTGPELERNLAMYVLCAIKEDRVEEIVENEIMETEEGVFWQIKEVTKLAKECLRVKGEERPTMKEVAMELDRLRVMQVEHLNLSDEASDSTSINVGCDNMNNNAMDHSIKAQILSRIPLGR
ncbi:wall-associated receptor kinase 2-like [Benincasa hispida]|uniref:wall-associated receptor kinase 2-like n=1 Tax=Benincasa hispida TaxID=102211 RepID=UPI0019009C18|nr:wall-associated receptor kinase 2-like [Benincasa hispida]